MPSVNFSQISLKRRKTFLIIVWILKNTNTVPEFASDLWYGCSRWFNFNDLRSIFATSWRQKTKTSSTEQFSCKSFTQLIGTYPRVVYILVKIPFRIAIWPTNFNWNQRAIDAIYWTLKCRITILGLSSRAGWVRRCFSGICETTVFLCNLYNLYNLYSYITYILKVRCNLNPRTTSLR